MESPLELSPCEAEERPVAVRSYSRCLVATPQPEVPPAPLCYPQSPGPQTSQSDGLASDLIPCAALISPENGSSHPSRKPVVSKSVLCGPWPVQLPWSRTPQSVLSETLP